MRFFPPNLGGFAEKQIHGNCDVNLVENFCFSGCTVPGLLHPSTLLPETELPL